MNIIVKRISISLKLLSVQLLKEYLLCNKRQMFTPLTMTRKGIKLRYNSIAYALEKLKRGLTFGITLLWSQFDLIVAGVTMATFVVLQHWNA